MKKKILFLSAAVTLFFAACKKDDPPVVGGMWKVDNTSQKVFINGATTLNTYAGQSPDYIDFRTDQKLYSNVNGTRDTLNYSVSNNQLTTTKTGQAPVVYDMKIFTNTTLQLYTKATLSATDYSEITVNLKR